LRTPAWKIFNTAGPFLDGALCVDNGLPEDFEARPVSFNTCLTMVEISFLLGSVIVFDLTPRN
jgi:hypothetical protein